MKFLINGLKHLRKLLVFFPVIFLSIFWTRNLSDSTPTPSRLPSSVSVDDEDDNSESSSTEAVVTAALPSQAESAFSSPSSFISALTQVPTSTEPRPSSLRAVSLSVVSRDSSYRANGVTFHLGGAAATQTAKIRKLILAEFQLYPASCFQRLGLRQLVTSADVVVEWPNRERDTRTATLDPTNGLMIYGDNLIIRGDSNIYLFYLDQLQNFQNLHREGRTDQQFAEYRESRRVYLLARRTEAFQSLRDVIHIIHHEFYHYWDLKEDGSYADDSEWSALNTSGFRYGNGGRFNTSPNASGWTSNHPGFLNEYSRSGVDEDKAEIWGALLAHSTQLQERMSTDPIIARKVALIKRRAQNYCPELNASFWNRAQQSNEARIQFLADLLQETDEAAASMDIPVF